MQIKCGLCPWQRPIKVAFQIESAKQSKFSSTTRTCQLAKIGSLFANKAIKFQGQPTANKQRQTVLLKYPEEQELLKVLKGQKIPILYTLFTEKHKDLRYLGIVNMAAWHGPCVA